MKKYELFEKSEKLNDQEMLKVTGGASVRNDPGNSDYDDGGDSHYNDGGNSIYNDGGISVYNDGPNP